LPRFSGPGPIYDTRITLGYIGLLVTCPEERLPQAQQAFRQGGAEDVVQEAARAR
ncbi:MAG: hypothetical protein HY681_14610, partial [Chloroflexi bacterium]|nr:hypothetical protein [Chloroflexota bacterium]